MTKQKPVPIQRRDSTRHFLYSKTDTQKLINKDIRPREDAWKAIKRKFPDVLSGQPFIDYAMDRLMAKEMFGAMAFKVDRPPKKEKQLVKYAEIAAALDALCKKENALWGVFDDSMLGGYFPEKDEFDCYRLARSFQKSLTKQTKSTVTIGIAAFPTLSYPKYNILDNARKALEHAVFFGPSSAQIFDAVSLNINGDQLYEKGDIQGAIEEFKQALLLDPANVNVHNSLGVCYGVQGEYKRAIKQFKATIALDSKEYMAIYNLGLINMLSGHKDKALSFFAKANGFTADVFEIVFQTGKLYLENGDFKKAQTFLEQASRLNPTAGAVFRYLGECHGAAGRTKAAITAYKKAVKQNPSDAASLSALGCLFDKEGENPEIATMFCQESVGLSPDNALFRYRLGRLYLKQNQLKKALSEFKLAVRLGHDASDYIKKIETQIKTKAS
ncbi:MAG: tetratricopeptide repeat protein [Desulfobacterales bacterium]|jgi:tetratricopeptide (TPR) repeat protein